MTRSFRFRSTLMFGLLALAVVAALAYGLGRLLAQQIQRDQGEALHTLAQSTGVLLAEGLHERMREVEMLAASAEVSQIGLDREAWTREVERLQRSRAHYAWIGVTDASGRVRASTGDLLLGQSVAERPWFKSALRAAYLGEPHPAKLLAALLPPRQDDDPLRFVDFAAPLRDAGGAVIGTLGVHGDWVWARDVIAALRSERKRDAGVLVFVLDRDGRVIHHPGGPQASATLAPGEKPPAQPVLMRWADGRDYLTAAAPLPARSPQTDLGWTVLVRQPAGLALAAVDDARRTMWQAGGAAVLGGMLLAWFALGRFAAPLVEIAGAARRIEAGDLHGGIPVTQRSRELEQLSTALAGMTHTLIGREQALAEANERLEARVAERTEALAEANAELARLVHLDGLTGLANRRAADERIESELARQRRHGGCVGLLLVDVDHFKRINDGHGHAVGDEVLRLVACCLRDTLRESDFCARFGGEEFVVLLPATDAAGTAAAAEKLRAAVAGLLPPPVGRITASFGAVSVCGTEVDPAGLLLERADAALYRAKARGRDRVEVAA
ncbi:MAG TPA: diguanylate cyclase [Methylibium sp.]|nr:diguanylate cyclase [Methylibium sp.]